MPTPRRTGLPETIDLSAYDFVDFGCSVGGSMAFAKKAFNGGTPVGIDIDEKKVARTKEAGFDAVLADATNPEQFRNNVRFSILSHFLEHLPDYDTVTRAIRTAVRISDEFVFIRQPWFDSDGDLFRNGLKFYWSDWHGHPMTLTALQMYRIARDHLNSGKIARATIYGNTPVVDTDDECVVPLSVPIDTGKYDLEAHGPKPSPAIPLNAYKELVVVLAIRDADITETLLGRFPRSTLLFDERRGEKPVAQALDAPTSDDPAAEQANGASSEEQGTSAAEE
jgi:hypothetical protein